MRQSILRYISSGWEPLVPYTALYWTFAMTERAVGKWDSDISLVPLLYWSYWVLHVAHLAIISWCAATWWRDTDRNVRNRLLLRLVPWAALVFLFILIGPFWEYPADPWEHLTRITQWQHVSHFQDHYSWKKSGYFLLYSMIGPFHNGMWCTVRLEHAAISLMLCWQYFRLARSTGLTSSASFIFVVLNFVAFGNNIFSFYRYYSVSTSAIAQIAAVAAVTVVVKCCTENGASMSKCLWAVLLAVSVAASNHVQAIGIAGIGILAVIVWSCIKHWGWRAYTGAATIALITSIITFLIFYKNGHLQGLVDAGWLNTLYCFDLTRIESPAAQRAIHILGALGLINLILAGPLIAKNQLVGWLCAMPVLVLMIPAIAAPFAASLHESGPTNILTFHRMLFASPVGLAVVAFGQRLSRQVVFLQGRWGYFVLTTCLFLGFSLSPAAPFFNRTWNSLARQPADLERQHVVEALKQRIQNADSAPDKTLLAPVNVGAIANAIGVQHVLFPHRLIIPPGVPSEHSERFLTALHALSVPRGELWLFLPELGSLSTSDSLAARLSMHWNPSTVALSYAGVPEALQELRRLFGDRVEDMNCGWYRVRGVQPTH